MITGLVCAQVCTGKSPSIGPDKDRTLALRLTPQGQHIGLVQANSRFYQRPRGRVGPPIGVGWKGSGRAPSVAVCSGGLSQKAL